jgi:hypothetical protein
VERHVLVFISTAHSCGSTPTPRCSEHLATNSIPSGINKDRVSRLHLQLLLLDLLILEIFTNIFGMNTFESTSGSA